MQSRTYPIDFAGKTITAEFTDLAARANGSLLMRSDDTVVLVTANMSPAPSLKPYFHLSVEFEERFYAAGEIMGSRFQRREARPSDEAVLSARRIDRAIRPLFDHSLQHEIQIVVTVLALGTADPDVLGIIGASLALSVSDIPWDGPISSVRIARRQSDGEILVNPSYDERTKDQLSFEVLTCGRADTLNMIETAAHEVSEPDLMAVLEAATQLHAQLDGWQSVIKNERDVEKRMSTVADVAVPDSVHTMYTEEYQAAVREALSDPHSNKRLLAALTEQFVASVLRAQSDSNSRVLTEWFENRISDELVQLVQQGTRSDGRTPEEVRPLYAQAGGLSSVLHGSGIFYRGQTHVLSTLTLGTPADAQLVDTIEAPESKKRFMHHYNFPPYAVGETGRIGSASRRSIGHGLLVENALRPVLPDADTFPQTVRLVSETLSSSGSSSMASVCAASVALLDGGVPISRPVAGIAIGLLGDAAEPLLLTDIADSEDAYGDMDCKVAGTSVGITAMQLDVKNTGVTLATLREALDRARTARLQILEVIKAEINVPRNEVAHNTPTAPRTYQVGEEYDVTITNIVKFGAFARLDEHTEGLIHISEFSPERVEDAAAVLNVDQIVPIVICKVEGDKIGLSIKQRNPHYFDQVNSE
jgi:polyribonucleotide nucleotidyltransferase